jgi:hypothetical protein
MNIEDDIKGWSDKVLPSLEIDKEKIDTYLCYPYEILQAFSIEELGQIVFDLKKYSLSLKLEFNKNKARNRWLNNVLLKAAKPLALNYSSYDKEERFFSAIQENPKLVEYFKTKENCGAKADILYDVNSSIDGLIYTIENILSYKIRSYKT